MPKSWKRRRREEFLAKWPLEDQVEALIENADGRPAKLNKILTDKADIETRIPETPRGPVA
jgi:hypothetical protein